MCGTKVAFQNAFYPMSLGNKQVLALLALVLHQGNPDAKMK